jgi:hypothetical protein
MIDPLAQRELPEPADLGPFWLQVEEAVRSLHETLGDLGRLQTGHIRQLAPVILGAKGWQHFRGSRWHSWQGFKDSVSGEFGLSMEQLSARYYALTPRAGEGTAEFVIRVEQQRRTLEMDEVATLHCFLPRLSAEH